MSTLKKEWEPKEGRAERHVWVVLATGCYDSTMACDIIYLFLLLPFFARLT